MAEGARLESVFTGNRNVGSNPTPSASSCKYGLLRWSIATVATVFSDRSLVATCLLAPKGQRGASFKSCGYRRLWHLE